MTLYKRLATTLNDNFSKRPVLCNSIAGFTISATGDFFSQGLEKKNIVDISRVIQTGLLGSFIGGGFLPIYYGALDRIFGSSQTNMVVVLSKVIADQIIYSPFQITTFFAYSSAVSHNWVSSESYSNQVKDKLRASFYDTWLLDCSIWPVINIINYRMVPLIYRPIFNGFADVFWQSYLNYVSFKKSHVQSDLV
jgi:protein Mpv17